MTQQRRRTFQLSNEQIQSLKQHVAQSSSVNGHKPAKPPTTYVAVSSLVWTSMVRARNLDHCDAAHFMVTADCRHRLKPPLGEGFFGNCVKPCFAKVNVGDLCGEDGLVHAAAAIQKCIRESLDDMEDPLSDIARTMEVYLGISEDKLTVVGSSHRFKAYETDFGWGAPSRVELVSLFATELVLLLGAQNGGVQVTATLRPEHMEAFASNLGRFSAVGCGLDGSQLPRGRTANEIPSTPASAPWSPCPPASPPAGEPRAGKRGQKQDATPE